MNQLICYIDLFSMEQEVYQQKEINTMPELLEVCRLSNLPEVLAILCTRFSATKIHLYGNVSYIEEKIIQPFKLKYQNNIEIEVN